jgi:hypothetical protein
MKSLASPIGLSLIAAVSIGIVIAVSHHSRVRVVEDIAIDAVDADDSPSVRVTGRAHDDAGPASWPFTAGARMTLPCVETGPRGERTAMPDLECHVDDVRITAHDRRGHVQCNQFPTILSDLVTSSWYFANPGGMWRTAHVTDTPPSFESAELPDAPSAFRKSYADPKQPYIGVSITWALHDGAWCTTTMPWGLGGAPHYDVDCYARSGELVGTARAKDESARFGVGCGMLRDLPTWIFSRT